MQTCQVETVYPALCTAGVPHVHTQLLPNSRTHATCRKWGETEAALPLLLEAFDFSEMGGPETWAEGPRSKVGISKSDPLRQ